MAIIMTPQTQSLMNQLSSGLAQLKQDLSSYSAQLGAPAAAPTQQFLPPPPSPQPSGGGAYINPITQQSVPIGTASPGYTAQGKPISGGSQLNTGTSVVDYLKSIGQDSSPEARAKLAQQYGIPNYDFSAAKNIELLSVLKSGAVPTGGTTPPAGATPPPPGDTTPSTPPEITPPPGYDPYAMYQQELAKLQSQIGQQQKGITPEEEALYTQMTKQASTAYDQAMADLVRQQEQEKQRLIGRFATMGFSEPGIVSGEVGTIPGVVTKALQELGQAQQTDVAKMISDKALGLTSIEQAKAETIRRAEEQASQIYNQQLQLLMSHLQSMAKPDLLTAGGIAYRYNPATGEVESVMPEGFEATMGKEAYSAPQVADDGTVYMVDYSKSPPQMITIGKVAKKPTADTEIKIVGDPYKGYEAYKIDKNTGKVIEVPITPISTAATTPSVAKPSTPFNILDWLAGIFNTKTPAPISSSPAYYSDVDRKLDQMRY